MTTYTHIQIHIHIQRFFDNDRPCWFVNFLFLTSCAFGIQSFAAFSQKNPRRGRVLVCTQAPTPNVRTLHSSGPRLSDAEPMHGPDELSLHGVFVLPCRAVSLRSCHAFHGIQDLALLHTSFIRVVLRFLVELGRGCAAVRCVFVPRRS